MDEARWEQLEAKRARRRYFEGLEEAAADSQRAARGIPTKRKPVKRKPPIERPEGAKKTGPLRSTRPSHCAGCGKPTRSQGTTIAEAPGTVAYRGKGLCGTCATKKGKTDKREKELLALG